MSHDLVHIHNLGVELGGQRILAGVNAALAAGRITALIGLNGSGKTTLLRALLKEVPYTGTIEFHCGHDHRRPDPRHVGYVPQKLRFDANLPLTVRDLLGLAMQRRPLFLGIRTGLQLQMVEMLSQVGAPAALLDRPVEKISGGELQRVLLALALFPSPELLLLDEPAAGIDFQDQEKFYHLITRINQERGVTVLLVSHDLTMVPKHAHHVLCLGDGRIKCQGPPKIIEDNKLRQEIFGSEKALYVHHTHGDRRED
jgi:zinc transport system ATP-binding protein